MFLVSVLVILFLNDASGRQGFSRTVPPAPLSTIKVFLPTASEYPEYGTELAARLAKARLEQDHPSIRVNISRFASHERNLIRDSEITRPLFQENQADSYCIGLGHSNVALEMATFLGMPTVTFSTLNYIPDGTQIPINPQYEQTTKALFNLLNMDTLDHPRWTRVNFVVSSFPWFKHAWDKLLQNIKEIAEAHSTGVPGHDSTFMLDHRDDEFMFELESFQQNDSYFSDLVSRATGSANIYVFIGHVCELRRFVITAHKEGFLKPGKVVIYLDVFGLSVLDQDQLQFSEVACSNFSGWGNWDEDQERLEVAMEYVILVVTTWTGLAKVDRARFVQDYGIQKPFDHSGFDILMVDALNLLTSYITRAPAGQSVQQFLSSGSVNLYSGEMKFEASGKRELPLGAMFIHGKGNVEFMRWENSCDGPYCPVTTDTGRKVQWAGGVKPRKHVDTSTKNPYKDWILVGSLTGSLLLVVALAWSSNHVYKKVHSAANRKLWALDNKNFDSGKTKAVKLASSHDGAFPKTYLNVTNLVGQFKGCDMFIKEVRNCSLNIRQNYKLTTELIKRVGGNHENVNFLVGIRERPNDLQIVQQFCSNGSLMDVLENNPMNIMESFEFKSHVLLDISRGMCHLHYKLNIPHCNLKTSNCLFDSRWSVRVSDFEPTGIRSFFEADRSDHEMLCAQLLWTAPEILNSSSGRLSSVRMKNADVYSFALISFHVLANSLPFTAGNIRDCSFTEIIKRVREGSEPPFRPQLKMTDCDNNSDFNHLVKSSWAENPSSRPSFTRMAQQLETWSIPGQSFGDFISAQMEEYSYGLDQKVQEMEEKLRKERVDFERLLQKMLPRQIASCIKAGRQPSFEQSEVSLYFSDIYNFAKISRLKKFREDPKLIVEFLNMLYEVLDIIVSCFQEKLYKVETINDSYLVMSGLPVRQEKHCHHAGFIANFALFVLSRVNEIQLEGYPDVKVQIRIGIHSGILAAGVIGKLNPRYCLFGDTVNFTSRLESTGKPFTIHTSENMVSLLKEHGNIFEIVERQGRVTLKNRGEHQTYFVTGMAGFEWELPKETLKLRQVQTDSPSDTASVASWKTGTESWAGDRRVSLASTEYTCSDTMTSSAKVGWAQQSSGGEGRRKKLSNSVLDMQNSVSNTLAMLLDKMRPPAQGEFTQERTARRAFSEPDGGNFSMEERKQRMSTPFRKESDESLYYRDKGGNKESNCLRPIMEPGLESDPLGLTPPSTTDTSRSTSTNMVRELLDEQGIVQISGMPLSELYNHIERSASERSSRVTSERSSKGESGEVEQDEGGGVLETETGEDREDLPTPTSLPGSLMKRRDTNVTLVAPTNFAIANCSMGVKRYSGRRKVNADDEKETISRPSTPVIPETL